MSWLTSKHFVKLFVLSQVVCFFFASLTTAEFAIRYLAALCALNICGYAVTKATRSARDVVREPILLFLFISPIFTLVIMAALMSRS